MKLEHLVSQGSLFLLCAWGCDQAPPPETSTGQSTQSMEWVGFHAEVPFAPADFHALVSGLIGPDAQRASFVQNKEILPGIFLSATAETATSAQSRVALTFDDGSQTPRTLALVPASFAVGNVFLTSVDAALAKMLADNAAQPNSGESFLIQYKVVSPQGGSFTLGVHAVLGTYSLIVDVTSPQTNLAPGKIGTPVSTATPYDTVEGTVWFHLTKDDFDFFASHAYGADGTGSQNFSDFALDPHNWLRLTVEPHLDARYVNVGFNVLGLDGTRTPVAKAPASLLAGSLFQAMVDRAMTTMLAQEKQKPGSSSPWSVPFFYDAPVGGGIVQVLAKGEAGSFVIDYDIQAPQHTLVDVPFLPYQPVTLAPAPDSPTTCDKLGNAGIILAPQGVFSITFATSDVVKQSATVPLVGNILCSVYNASDVDVAGPKLGAVSLGDFTVPNANLNAGPPPAYMTQVFPAGAYQLLCVQDLNNDGKASKGEPVTLPIGSFPIACNLNPITVQFALLDPQ